MTPRPIVLVGHVLIALFLWPTPFIALPATVQTDPAPLRTLYVNNTMACADAVGQGLSPSTPFCTIAYASTVVIPGDLVRVSSLKDNAAPVQFTRSGTAANPITYQSTVGTWWGRWTDLNDEGFVAQPLIGAHVWMLTNAATVGTPQVYQTYFPNILVDDVNASRYYMYDASHVPNGGPVQLKSTTSDAELVANEGAYKWVGTTLYVHPFGNRSPSATTTDFVRGGGTGLTVAATTRHNTFDGFTYVYPGVVSAGQVLGSPNILRNFRMIGYVLVLKGAGSTVEDFRIFHNHSRPRPGIFDWTQDGSGIAAIIYGSGHTIRRGELYASWNAEISSEHTTGNVTYDSIKVHASPNHCSVASDYASTISNVQMFNCQDYQSLLTPRGGMVMRHMVLAGNGLNIEASGETLPLGPITMTHSIMKGFIQWGATAPVSLCTWEAGSLFEYNVFQTNATIERCAPGGIGNGQVYTIAAYQAACEAGTITQCATFRHNRFVPLADWDTVVTGGMWPGETDVWDVTLVPGSPAIDIGPSSILTDILRVPRPQPVGGLSDAGIYEVTDDKPALPGAFTITAVKAPGSP